MPGEVERRHGIDLARCGDETRWRKIILLLLKKARADELADCTFVLIFAGKNAEPASRLR
jgi:hypothetical protein